MKSTSSVIAAALMAATAGCRSTPPPPMVAPLPPIPVATPAPPGAPTHVPVPLPVPAPVSATFPDAMAPPLIRVWLERPGDPQFPEAGRLFAALTADGARTLIRGPIRVTPTSAQVVLQAGAFFREPNAHSLAERLRTGGVDARVEPGGDGVWRVLVQGKGGESEAALSERLAVFGVARPVRPGVGRHGGSVQLEGENGQRVVSEWLRLVPLDPAPVRVGSKALRGEFLLRSLGDRVGVINEINVEVYLRGVVPAEMGPRVFPALEALKAQAVAARTYAVAHLRDRQRDAYDLCDTQSCQVYGGAGSEHPLSDQAILETANIVATFAGHPIDAMYHSTCAGHTEDAAAVFPQRAAPYLRGVPCRWSGDHLLLSAGPVEAGPWLGEEDRLALVGRAVAAALGVAAQPGTLAARLSGRPARDGLTGYLEAFGLEEPTRILLHGGRGGVREQDRLLALARAPRPAPGRSPEGEGLALVIRLAQVAGRVREAIGRLEGGEDSTRALVEGNGNVVALDRVTLVLERQGNRWRAASLAAAPGTPASAWCVDERCVAVEVDSDWQADGGSSWGWWTRELPLGEVASRLGLPAVIGVEVTARGRSGRALTVRTHTGDGHQDHNAYSFRLRLGLPDTLFVVTVETSGQGAVARFVGRGWGHGVGMCQHGAFGLALGGASFAAILGHYYQGIALERWSGR